MGYECVKGTSFGVVGDELREQSQRGNVGRDRTLENNMRMESRICVGYYRCETLQYWRKERVNYVRLHSVQGRQSVECLYGQVRMRI